MQLLCKNTRRIPAGIFDENSKDKRGKKRFGEAFGDTDFLKRRKLYRLASKEQIWQRDAAIKEKSYRAFGDIPKGLPNSICDTLGNLVVATVKNKSVDYAYNELNQRVKEIPCTKEVLTYSYNKYGNRMAEIGKKTCVGCGVRCGAGVTCYILICWLNAVKSTPARVVIVNKGEAAYGDCDEPLNKSGSRQKDGAQTDNQKQYEYAGNYGP